MNTNISVIIPVLNESQIINSTIDYIYSLDFDGDAEIIVADGSTGGKTINAINHPDVKKIIAKKGRGSQMNKGAAVASGDVLLFLHADTLLSHDALDQIIAASQSQDVVGGAFDLGIRSEKKIFRAIERGASIRSRLTRIPYGDQAIFIKRRFFNQIGGYKDIPIMEDVDLMRRIKASGKKIKIIPCNVQTTARRWEKEGILYCTLRNYTLIMLYYLGVSPDKLKKFYSS
jgi:rSAM/selenodomain-associated transferase 2